MFFFLHMHIKYVVPTRKSKRRGILPGQANIVLYPPMPQFILEKLKPVPVINATTTTTSTTVDGVAAAVTTSIVKEEKPLVDREEPKEEKPLVDREEPKEEKQLQIMEEKQEEKHLNVDESSDGGDGRGTNASPKEDVSGSNHTNASTNDTNPSLVTKPQKITPSDRSKALAQSRILLDETISSLKEICQLGSRVASNSTSTSNSYSNQQQQQQQQHQQQPHQQQLQQQHDYKGCIIELSKSQKIWKPDYSLDQLYELNLMKNSNITAENKGTTSANGSGSGSGNNNIRKNHGFNYHLKYDSTVEQSEDFKKFMENRSKVVEERKNRPKPSPGGISTCVSAIAIGPGTGTGTIHNSSGSSTVDDDSKIKAADENGHPLAAIVLHLREKKALNRKSKIQSKNDRAVSSGGGELSKKSSKKKKNGKGSEKGLSSSANKGGGKKKSANNSDVGGTGGGKKKKKRNKAPSVAPSMILAKPGSK